MVIFDKNSWDNGAISENSANGSFLPESVMQQPVNIKGQISSAVAGLGIIPRLLPVIEAYESKEIRKEQTEFCMPDFVYAASKEDSFWKNFKLLRDWHVAAGVENPDEAVLRDVEQLLILELRLSDFIFEAFKKDGKAYFMLA
ncbi:MAG: hypothetical protein FWE50_03270 [Alphaproteobacteria bacterium]|nr:hypothetical protein [Alphaproteobacteria bacterium]